MSTKRKAQPVWVQLVWNASLDPKMKPDEVNALISEHLVNNSEDYSINLERISGFRNVLHLIIRVRPNQGIAQVISTIKVGVSDWIQAEHPALSKRFQWLEGSRSFTIKEEQIDKIVTFLNVQSEFSGDQNGS